MHKPRTAPTLRRRLLAATAAAALVTLFMASPAAASVTTKSSAPAAASAATPAAPKVTKKNNVKPLCARPAKKNKAQCFALMRVDVAAHKGVQPNVTVSGFGPTDLTSAYNLPANGGAGQTVAIVDAFDDPNAEADLAVYRAQFGLPECTTANGCFSKVDQRGGTSYPPADAGWAGEISLDVDMVSAVAPAAHILLVEADDNFNNNLQAAVDEAVALGAKYVSNSYGSAYDSTPGSGEDPSEVTDGDPHYNHPGVAVVASSGDDEFGVSYPAASQYVTSVGGTSLVRDTSTRGWSESVWNNSFGGPGSGCSIFEAKPTWQTDSGCSMRTVADVSAVADPLTGVAVYDTYQNGGWGVFGGTSASSPIIASVFADSGTPVAGTYPSSYPYADTSALNDVTTGNNGSCSPTYLCTAGPGYDGPTGLGTPNGLAAFTTGPHGTVTGTVTDSATNAGIAGATVSVDDSAAITDSSGHYSVSVPVGTYDATAAAYGYQSKTVNNVVVTDGGSVTENFALVKLPTSTVSGTVTDGSGHNWPLYATISADGVPGGPVYTDPFTGHYSMTLPQGQTFTLRVSANYPGYQQVTQDVTVGTSATNQNVSVPIDAQSCDAPGYQFNFGTPALSQSFDGDSIPSDWTVVDNEGNGQVWQINDPEGQPNLTGGSGNFADINSDFYGFTASQDTSLVSPVMDLSGEATPVLRFNTDYFGFPGQTGDVDVTTDGGATWTTVWQHTDDSVRGPTLQEVELPAGSAAAVQVRFHFTSTFGFWWEVDNVSVLNRSCDMIPGGLVAGLVTDANTNSGVVGAKVTSVDHPADFGISSATPNDPNLPDGFYWMFSSLTG
ncbi:MAG TPA: carboxypeptidase regulatory-like domain-containing protein, partial [Micromonosporaceae bacterium]